MADFLGRRGPLFAMLVSAALEKADEDEGYDDVNHERVHVASLEGMAAYKGDHDGGENDGNNGVHEIQSFHEQ